MTATTRYVCTRCGHTILTRNPPRSCDKCGAATIADRSETAPRFECGDQIGATVAGDTANGGRL
jgi:ribosomal protein S27AE